MTDAWSVLITGPMHGIEAWATAAREAGWSPQVAPLLRVEERDVELLPTGTPPPDWIAITSSNALPSLERAARGNPALRGLPLAAVGRSTAEAAAAAGFRVELVPGDGNADALADELLRHSEPGSTVLWPRGDKAARLGERLESEGRTVLAPIVYETSPAELPDGIPSTDVVFFASPSATRVWAERAGDERPFAIAIGWTTFDALKAIEERFSTIIPLHEPTPGALKLCLESFQPTE